MKQIKKSKITAIKKQEKWNDLFKFELKFEDGTVGLMFKKTDNPYCEIGENVMFTINPKGTIKIIKEGQEKFVNNNNNYNNDDNSDVIMMQCMYKAAASFYAHKETITEQQVSETAYKWFYDAKNELKTEKFKNKKEINESEFVPF
tara:strand:- start:5124 stop:5561 length:438 start_codon:yes stop_codon:yes gene_type:complete